jgi:hypothetical protein
MERYFYKKVDLGVNDTALRVHEDGDLSSDDIFDQARAPAAPARRDDSAFPRLPITDRPEARARHVGPDEPAGIAGRARRARAA